MIRGRLVGVARILRQQPYEAAIGLVGLSGLLEVSRTSRSLAAAVLYPHWVLVTVGIVLAAGGATTLGGLAGAGTAVGDVGRVMARRFEQAGQFLLCGGFMALGAAAGSFGVRGLLGATVYGAIGCAALIRAVMISQVIARAGRDEGGVS